MKETTFLLILVYFSILFVISRFKTPHISGGGVYLFRAFFPSWKFFEDYGDVPSLFYRLSSNGDKFGDWVPCLTQPKRRLSSLLVNPEGNFYLACSSLLQQVMSELDDATTEKDEARAEKIESFDKTVVYQLTHDLVRYQIAQRHAIESEFYYQFKVCSCLDALPKPRMEDVLISSVQRLHKDVEPCLKMGFKLGPEVQPR